MKTLPLYLALSFTLLWFRTDAAILIVNNQSTAAHQYRSFEAAQHLAHPGDTIALMATALKYPRIYINKSLTVIGVDSTIDAYPRPCVKSVVINASNVVVHGLAAGYIYCNAKSEGAWIQNNQCTTIAIYDKCHNITLFNNAFNIIDIGGTVTNLILFNNKTNTIDETKHSTGNPTSSLGSFCIAHGDLWIRKFCQFLAGPDWHAYENSDDKRVVHF